ncbi:hypothetical protein PR003_g28607 [Phytophthora rubi]|uniref:RxLR effector protein n=1 Tax=Phytophthora rubi TaxID=129364 RepID=A0A6A3HFG3_9STRA|nr:hypothetical protein PR002_g27967 [Phytophthora rubi]KAE8974495.1 hypothetical protein PR001_g25974 [Phytophthora rubi]KAE9278137.1 hypothetical protein PR003_g28607 [Phytophthora rubi]
MPNISSVFRVGLLVVQLFWNAARICSAAAAPARGSCNNSNVSRMLTQVTLMQYRGINLLRAVTQSELCLCVCCTSVPDLTASTFPIA